MTSCDACSLCCKVLNIDAVDSPQGKYCRHARPGAGGCKIYHERPPACVGFQCLWLMSQGRAGQEYEPPLRPDRSGVVFVVDAMAVPQWLLTLLPGQRFLLAHCERERPNAWREGLANVLIRNFLRRDGFVLVLVGDRRGLLRPGLPPLWGSEEEIMGLLGVYDVPPVERLTVHG
jgi:hypothetical protein